MLVLFRPSPQSIVKAFLAGRLRSARPLEASSERRFYFEETVDADQLDYNSLYSEYREKYGGLDFLEDEKLYDILEDEIFWASRSKYHDRFQLVFEVLGQIEKAGTKQYLAQATPEAKEMKDRIRRVTGELRRAKGVMTFSEDTKNSAVIGKASFEHNITDLVLRHFARRHPGKTVVILDREHAHILHDDHVLLDSRSKFPDKPGRKDARRYWTLLSDPKHAESMKDPLYDVKALPRNYWKWVAEGAEEERAAPRPTLDDFAVRQES